MFETQAADSKYNDGSQYFRTLKGLIIDVDLQSEDAVDPRLVTEGPALRISYSKKHHDLTNRVFIPKSNWLNVSREEFFSNFSAAVRQSLQLFLQYVVEKHESRDPELLASVLDELMNRFDREAVNRPFQKVEIWESDRFHQLKAEGKL
jgi:hypothetical protein